MQELILAWIRDVCKLELGTDTLPHNDEMEVTWAQQATPSTLYGLVVLGFIGDYCPLAAMYNPATFWKQDSIHTVRY